MLNWIKTILAGKSEEQGPPSDNLETHDIRIAACALFLEMANIDGEFSDTERQHLTEMLKSEYGLSNEQVADLTAAAEKERKESISLWQFTDLVNQNYTEAEKIRVVELLWKLIYSDGKLDQHEDYLVHRLASLLGLHHKQLIAAKLKALPPKQA